MVNGAKQYRKLVTALSAFDDLITSVYVTDIDHSGVNKQDVVYLKQLFAFLISGKSENKDTVDDQYLLSLLYAYQQHKTHIVINLDYLNKYRSKVKADLLEIILYDGLEKYLNNDYDGDSDDEVIVQKLIHLI